MNTKSVVILKNVSKSYYIEKPRTIKVWLKSLFSPFEKFFVIKNFSMNINKGEFVLVNGRNGSGKTTLLRLIAGITEADRGIIETNGKVVPILELGAGFNPELTGRENITINATILNVGKKNLKLISGRIIKLSGLKDFIDVPVKRYSTGMISRLAFSIAVHSNPDILLLDEVFAVGDREFQKKSIKILTRFHEEKKTIIVCSHFNLKIPFLTKKINLK